MKPARRFMREVSGGCRESPPAWMDRGYQQREYILVITQMASSMHGAARCPPPAVRQVNDSWVGVTPPHAPPPPLS